MEQLENQLLGGFLQAEAGSHALGEDALEDFGKGVEKERRTRLRKIE